MSYDSYPLPLSKDHQVFEQEYCSGYVDSFGKWNTGFYCPPIESKIAVSCCGTPTFKYCCITEKLDEPLPDDIVEHFAKTPILAAIITGTLLALFVITFASCFYCSCCCVYRKRRGNEEANGLYQLQSGSTASELVNMYSPCNGSNHTSLVTTPLDMEWSQQMVGSGGSLVSGNSSFTAGGNSGSGGPPTVANGGPPAVVSSATATTTFSNGHIGGSSSCSSGIGTLSLVSNQQQTRSNSSSNNSSGYHYVNLPPGVTISNSGSSGYPRILNANGLLRAAVAGEYHNVSPGILRYQNVVSHGGGGGLMQSSPSSNTSNVSIGPMPTAFYRQGATWTVSNGRAAAAVASPSGNAVMVEVVAASAGSGLPCSNAASYQPVSILRTSSSSTDNNARCMRPAEALQNVGGWRSPIEDPPSYVNVLPPPSYTQVDTQGSRVYSNLAGSRAFDRPNSDTFTQIYYNELLREARASNGGGGGGLQQNQNGPLSNTLPRRQIQQNHSVSEGLPPTGLASAGGGTMNRRSFPANLRNLVTPSPPVRERDTFVVTLEDEEPQRPSSAIQAPGPNSPEDDSSGATAEAQGTSGSSNLEGFNNRLYSSDSQQESLCSSAL